LASCRRMITYFDGEFVDDEKAKISVRSRAVNYGLGCFGGVRGYLADDGEQVLLFRVPDHMLRLQHSAKVLFMRLPGDHAMLCGLVPELLRRNEVRHDVYVRPILLNNSVKLAPVLREEDSLLAIYCLPLQRYIDKEAIDVCVSSWRRATDSAIPARTKPTGLYLNSALARREAHDNGFDEAIFLTEHGKVSEGSAEHVFLIRDGVLLSPPSHRGQPRRDHPAQPDHPGVRGPRAQGGRAHDRADRDVRDRRDVPVRDGRRDHAGPVGGPSLGRSGRGGPDHGPSAEALRRRGPRAGPAPPRVADARVAVRRAAHLLGRR
jgi:branched-subunit amino acid aminotransferase/4-amino-4-deoxychorismate lyase